MMESAEAYHRQHGEAAHGLNMSVIEVPEPWENSQPSQTQYEVRTKVGGQVLTAVFDFDPLGEADLQSNGLELMNYPTVTLLGGSASVTLHSVIAWLG